MNVFIKKHNGELPYGFGSWMRLYAWFKENQTEPMKEGMLYTHEFQDKNGDITKNEFTIPYLKCMCFDEMATFGFTTGELRYLEFAIHESYNADHSQINSIRTKLRAAIDLRYQLGDYD